MRRYGLIGKPLDHSWSKHYFDKKFADEGCDCRYGLYAAGDEVESAEEMLAWLDGLIREQHLMGFNVTAPFKQWMARGADALSPEAAAIGAVNCVQVAWQGDGTFLLKGFNTDAPAFRDTLRPLLRPWHRSALVLGTGGAAHAVAYALRQLGIGLRLVSRQPEAAQAQLAAVSYEEAAELTAGTYLIINATPVGMSPLQTATPWPYARLLTPRHLCYDLIYNPSETLFLRESKLAGAAVQNGLSMLTRQADCSWQLWQEAE